MADNIIKVTVSSSTKKNVTVSSANVGTEITASSDTGKFWAQTSKNWAVSDNIVDNTDYSSKYYANKAKESANIAQSNAGVCGDIYNSVQEVSQTVFTNIDTKSEEVLTNIDNAKTEAVDSINSTKSTAISDIEFVADGEKQEIEDLINTGKDELKESIGDVKILTTLGIGDIGIAPLGIDETQGKRRYLNGQLIIQEQYVQFTDKVKSAIALYPSLACTESEWQTTATMTVGGQVGKFVVDDEGGTIRLPKIIMPIQGLTDLSKLAEIVEAGLPSHTHSLTLPRVWGSGTNANYGAAWGGDDIKRDDRTATTTGASNSIYGNSSTVQQEQIQYPYFIQVATGAETEDNIINEIELNNPFSLLDYKFSEYELNNLSWLRSNGQYNSKAVYPAVYDLLLKIYNGTETKTGVSVKLTTETFTDYDFVLNTAEETFRLPIKVKLASGKAVVGNRKPVNFVEPTLDDTTAGIRLSSVSGSYNVIARHYVTSESFTNGMPSETGWALTPKAENSGIETSDSGLYLYFYVGETVQNANLINAGRIEEKVADLIPNNSSLIAGYAMPSNRYIDLTLGASGTTYTAPANGWVFFKGSTTTTNASIFFKNQTAGLMETSEYTPFKNVGICSSMCVSKNDLFTLTYTNVNKTFFRFIYAQGEV